MGWTDWFSSNKDGDTGGFAPLTNFSHNITDWAGLPDPWNQLYGDPAKKQQAALAKAEAEMHQLADTERARQMEGLDKAMGAYGKTQKVYDALYGDPSTLKVASRAGIR